MVECIQSLRNDDALTSSLPTLKRTDCSINIVLDPDGTLIDSRNRLETCKRAKVEPKFETPNGSEVQATRERSINLSDRFQGLTPPFPLPQV
jgi:hypothetical protein